MRQPVDYIIVYRDACSRTYGQGQCNAELGKTGAQKCFNTINTCQTKKRFNRVEHKDIFITATNLDRPANQIKMHDGQRYSTVYPFLLSVSHTPATVNPAGASSSASPLGTRAKLSCSLTDAGSNDFYQDPYYNQRIDGTALSAGGGYEPDSQGTFFTKYFARNPYLVNRKVEWVTGELINGEVKNWVKRIFFISDVADPNANGGLSITAQDVLGLTNVKNAQAPIATGLAIGTSISASAKTIDFNLDNPDFKSWAEDRNGRIYARINDEIVRFRWSGGASTAANSVERGIGGTLPAEHNELDSVQPCWVIDGKNPAEILEQLLTSFTSIPPDLLDVAQWRAAVSASPHLNPSYGLVIISDPAGVDELLGDMAQQMQFYPYFNEDLGKIHIAPVTPEQNPSLVIQNLNESANYIEDSLQVKKKQNEVATRISMFNRVRNWAEKLDDSKNYFTNDVFTNFEEEDDNHNRQSQGKKITGYWLGGFTLVEPLGMRLVQNFAKPPLEYSFSLDAKDSHLKVADFVSLDSRLITDPLGVPQRIIAQITQIKGGKNSTLDVKAVSYNFSDSAVGAEPRPYLIYIESGFNVSTRNEFFKYNASPPWDLISDIKLILRRGTAVGSSSTSKFSLTHDLELPDLYTGPTPTLVIEETAIAAGAAGKGGNGAKGADGQAGRRGGDAIKIEQPIVIDNKGIIGGGGGGGGGGGAAKGKSKFKSRWANSGGGGAGAGNLAAKGGTRGTGGSRSRDGGDGKPTKNIFTGGAGGSGATYKGVQSGKGGKGGDLGQAGEKGQNAISGSKGRWSGGSGGAAGAAIVEAQEGLVTFVNRGDIRGAAPWSNIEYLRGAEIIGIYEVGETLEVEAGLWRGEDLVFTYQWQLNNTNLAGKTSKTLELTQDFIGGVISCRITASNPHKPSDTHIVTGQEVEDNE